eukprot:Opistho-1_new@95607
MAACGKVSTRRCTTGGTTRWRGWPRQHTEGSEQFLLRAQGLRPEPRGVQRLALGVEAQARAGLVEALADQVGPDTTALHALRVVGVVVLAAAHLLHARHHAQGAVRVVQVQPLAEHRTQLERQAQHRVGGAPRAGLPRGFEHLLHVVVDERDLRRHAHTHGNARIGQRAQGAQAPVGCGGTRLQDARELRIQRGDGHVDRGQALCGHGREQVDVALHPAALGDDGQRVPRFGEHFEHAAHEPVLALDGLVGVGHGADGEQAGHVARAGELAPQHGGDVALGNQFRLEIETGRKIQEAVAGPRVAVDAAVFAAPVGVEAELETDVGRVVVGDGAPAVFPAHLGGGRQCLVARPCRAVQRAPAVVEGPCTLR